MIYYNYDTDQVLILDQPEPAVTKAQLWYKDKQLHDEPVGIMCICKWYKDIGYDEYS